MALWNSTRTVSGGRTRRHLEKGRQGSRYQNGTKYSNKYGEHLDTYLRSRTGHGGGSKDPPGSVQVVRIPFLVKRLSRRYIRVKIYRLGSGGTVVHEPIIPGVVGRTKVLFIRSYLQYINIVIYKENVLRTVEESEQYFITWCRCVSLWTLSLPKKHIPYRYQGWDGEQ